MSSTRGRSRRASVAMFCLALCGAIIVEHQAAVAGGTSAGGFSSDNVEWVRTVAPMSNGGAVTSIGGAHVDNYFYLTSATGLTIYDTEVPDDPSPVGQLSLPFQAHFEDPATNGKILLAPGGGSDELLVIDVRDKSNPRVLSRLPGATDHTYTCLFDCRWAYGSIRGLIIDLRDPRRPRLMTRRWFQGLKTYGPAGRGGYGAHDLTKIAPGMVLTGSVPMYLLDVREPLRPKVLARSDGAPYSYGAVAWPGWPQRDVAISSSYGLSSYPRCEVRDQAREVHTPNDTSFRTWDASEWRITGIISGGHQYRIENGTYSDGDPAVSGAEPFSWSCMTLHFDWRETSDGDLLVALAASGHGIKFLRVSEDTKIREVGYFLPHGGTAMGAVWITDEILYTVDHHRGIDVLRYSEESE